MKLYIKPIKTHISVFSDMVSKIIFEEGINIKRIAIEIDIDEKDLDLILDSVLVRSGNFKVTY